MSDETGKTAHENSSELLPAGTPAQIDETEIERFFKATWKLFKCDLCESSAWGLPPELVRYAYIPTGDGSSPTTLTKTVMPCLVASCLICGNTKLQSTGIIKRWLMNNPSSDLPMEEAEKNE